MILNIDSWLNLSLVMTHDSDFKDYTLLDQTILPYPVFMFDTKENIPGIIHTFWFKEISTNTLIDFHILYTFKDKKAVFIPYFIDKFMRCESNNPELRINSILMNHEITENKNMINKVISNTPKTIINDLKLTHKCEFKTMIAGNKKDTLENKLLNYVYEKCIGSEEHLSVYYKEISKLYNVLFKKKMNDKEFIDLINEKNTYFQNNGIKNEKIDVKKSADKKVKSDKSLMGILERNAFGNRQMLIFGRHGVGKTYGIRKFVEKHGYKLVIIQANNSVDDIYLKGHLMRDYDGNFKWKYGKLSLAYKMAEKEKIIVFIDEFLRLPETTFNNLITAMDPYDGNYLFDTERPIKDDSFSDCLLTEEVVVPTSNLWFICSTNIGSEYNVEELEPALKDRFIPYHLNMEDNDKYSLIKKIVIEKGFATEAENVINFFKKMQKLYKISIIPSEINIRHISDIVLMAENEDDLKYRLYDKILVWVNNDLKGNPIKEQFESVKKALFEVWSEF